MVLLLWYVNLMGMFIAELRVLTICVYRTTAVFLIMFYHIDQSVSYLVLTVEEI